MGVTKLTQPINVNAPDKDIVFDGFDFTADAYVSVTSAKSVAVRNCRIYGLNTTSKAKNYWLMIDSASPVKLRIENCFFGDNQKSTGSLYNMIEPHVKLSNASGVNENYFTAKCCTHNAVNLYGAEENSHISVNGNVFEVSAGTVRIGVQGEPVCDIEISDNAILAEHPDYGPDDQGLVTVQPYGKQTTTFKNMTVRMDGNSCPSEQLIYGYYGSQDTALTNDNMPLIQVDGVAITAPIYH